MENRLFNARATLPVYDRNNLAPKIVHLGFGAFHRAHQACMPISWLPSITVIGATMK